MTYPGFIKSNVPEVTDMNNVKTILTVIAVILGAVLALAAIGMIVTALQYLLRSCQELWK